MPAGSQESGVGAAPVKIEGVDFNFSRSILDMSRMGMRRSGWLTTRSTIRRRRRQSHDVDLRSRPFSFLRSGSGRSLPLAWSVVTVSWFGCIRSLRGHLGLRAIEVGMGAPLSRRDFLRGRGATKGKVVPPGFLGTRPEVCSSCSLCLERCPSGIIVMDHGLPALDFTRGECTFCGECRAHCPQSENLFAGPVLLSHVVEIDGGCLAMNGVDCQACRDHCPTDAIRFRPRLGGPFLPEINDDACSGCGACIGVCPVAAVAVKAAEEFADA